MVSRCIIKKKGGGSMKIKWYGHAAFRVITASSVKIIIDPYQSGSFGGALSYGKISDQADIVLISHDHDDHNYTKDVQGKFTQIKKEGSFDFKDVRIRAIPSFHDPSKGKERGGNLIFVIHADGLVVTHMGDIGHVLDKGLIKGIGKIDILLLPVGGFYTIDAQEATRVMNDLAPSITIPMHFKTEKCNFPIAPFEEFTKGKKDVHVRDISEIEITKETLPKTSQIVVLQNAL
ncbi:MAG TPA: MBL fold metallo-hydrolase [Deltaproteobacteria bacterium]|nr:MBL fold metallo-hydrolase [Deltaproteobacteria bacterium]